MKTNILGISVLLVLLCTSCSREAEPTVLIVYHNGNEYSILDRGDTVDQSKPASFIRYYSADIGSESVLKAEREDLYALVAKHIDTNKHKRVVIEAVEKEGRIFGIMNPREIHESISAEKVMTYKPASTPKAKTD